MKFIEKLKKRPVAINTAEANDQHYEVPTEFFLKVCKRSSLISFLHAVK
jgi:cyclopropane-fatty-acyl-phospholipid synthase